MGHEIPSIYDLPWLYDEIVQPGPCETFYRQLAHLAGGPVLELACGTGRLTVPIAADGHAVVGLDRSTTMLKAARAKAEFVGVDLELMQGDMCNFELGRRFGLVIVTCNSLAHLVAAQDLTDCLSAVARHLIPEGVFAFDVANPDLRQLAQLPSSRSEQINGSRGSQSGDVQPIAYDPVRQIQTSEITAHAAAGTPLVAPMQLRVFFPQELSVRVALAGLEIVEVCGDFSGGPFASTSSNQVYIARQVTSGR